MLLSVYIFFQIVALSFFVTAFFTKQEILWFLSVIISGMLMIASFGVQLSHYVFDSGIGAYEYTTTSYNFTFLFGINLVFFFLGIILGFFDIFDKYGNKIGKKVE